MKTFKRVIVTWLLIASLLPIYILIGDALLYLITIPFKWIGEYNFSVMWTHYVGAAVFGIIGYKLLRDNWPIVLAVCNIVTLLLLDMLIHLIQMDAFTRMGMVLVAALGLFFVRGLSGWILLRQYP